MKKLLPLSLLVFAASGLAACGGSKPAPKLVSSFIDSSLSDGSFGAGSWTGHVYQADLYDNGCYRYTATELNYGYSMLLSTTAIVNYGTYEKGASEDGITTYTLNAAAEVFLDSFSKAGGFSIVLQTPSQTYPVEMPAKTQGEKNMANSKADILKEYGQGMKIFADEAKFTFSTIDPATDEEAAPVTAASGDVSSILKGVKKFQIANDFKNPGSMGPGSWDGDVHIATIYSDDTYSYTKTQIKYGYSMLLSTTTVNTIGKATFGATEDGYTKVNFAEAEEVLLNSNSKAGGFNLQVNTLNATYPTELPAKAQGEKNMAQSKEDVIKAYGAASHVYLSDTTGTMSLVDPNA